MFLHALEVRYFRILEHCEIQPSPGFNLITGANASGKTSLLEAIYLLSTGRSFVSPRIEALISKGQDQFSVFARVITDAAEMKLGIARHKNATAEIRINGETVRGFSKLAQQIVVQVIHPGSETLLTGGPKEKRNFLDWGLFHVEHAFYPLWQRYQKILAQRNAALKQQKSSQGIAREVAVWDTELATAGEAISSMRELHLKQLIPEIETYVGRILSNPNISLRYHRGWPESETLSKALHRSIEKDSRFQQTSFGPHRADLTISYTKKDARHEISRGQRKALVYAMRLAQMHLLEKSTGRKGILLLDDLPSELDAGHQRRVWDVLSELDVQCFISAITPEISGPSPEALKVFHVEQGSVQELL